MELNSIVNNILYLLCMFFKYKLLSFLIDEISNIYGLFNTFFIVLFVIYYLNYFELR